MAVSTLVATAGAANANSYITLADADQNHEDRPAVGTTWADATSDEKNAALLFATKMLDSLVVWTGWVASETQSLLWPRTGMVYRNGYSVDTDVVPTELQEATAEFARQSLVGDITGNSDVEAQGITKIKAGSVEIAFDQAYIQSQVLPDLCTYYLPASWYSSIGGQESSTRELMRA